MTGTAGLVSGIAGLLALIALMPPVAARLRVPYTVLLAALGIVLGLALQSVRGPGVEGVEKPIFDLLEQFGGLPFSAEIFLWVFLPILLFETALSLDGRELVRDLGPVLVLAVLAVVVTTALGGIAVWSVSSMSLVAGLLVASIIATTDPIAVVAIFREVGAPRRLTALVEGESLLNDAAAIALFSALLSVVIGASELHVDEMCEEFIWDFLAGALVGMVLGRIAALLVSRLDQGGPAEVTLSVALAYLTYAFAEHYVHASGVVAVVLAGLVFGTVGRNRVATREWLSVTSIWAQLGFWASSLVFVLASMLVPNTMATATAEDWLTLAALIAAALVARALTLFGVLPVLSFFRWAQPIGWQYKLVILWGGLRGAVTLALALAVSENNNVPPDVQHFVQVVSTGFVLFTLLVQATSLRPLIRVLGLTRLSPVEQILRERALGLTHSEILDQLSAAAISHGLDLTAADEVKALDLQRGEALEGAEDLGEEMLREQLVTALATVTSRESELYVEEIAERMVTRTTGAELVREAAVLIDSLKSEGVHGYRHTARLQSGFDRWTRMAAFLHRQLGWHRWLARRLATHLEKLLVRRRVIEQLLAFSNGRIVSLFGKRVAETAGHVLEARLTDVDRTLDALRLQYPDYSRIIAGRYLSSAAIALEADAYSRMRSERLLSDQVYRSLVAELRGRRRLLEHTPRLDLGLDIDELLSRVPAFASLTQADRAELGRLLRPRLALPGEKVVVRGERGDAMYFIASGAVEVVFGQSRVRLGSGDFFGEVALLLQRPRAADVVAITFCRLLELRRDSFKPFLRAHPELIERVREVATARVEAGSTAVTA
ncbi:MAG: cation:proton antiporter [Geminicoccaceae bacterium]